MGNALCPYGSGIIIPVLLVGKEKQGNWQASTEWVCVLNGEKNWINPPITQ